LVTTNYNGDSCDVGYNIFLDPLFEDPGSGNYQITWTNWPTPDSTKSPCIDAGDPASPHDPDSTITDMGCYFFFNQQVPSIQLSASVLDFGDVVCGQTAQLPLKISNTGTANLILHNILCSLSLFTTDWNPADSIITPGDSLTLTISFTPTDTISYCDTLCVHNSDSLCTVQLLGRGITLVGVDESNTPDLPKEYALRQAYPNPFNPTTSIGFDLPKESNVVLKIHNILGQEVATLVSERLPAGRYRRQWHATGLGSGVYFYTMHAGEFVRTHKLLLLR